MVLLKHIIMLIGDVMSEYSSSDLQNLPPKAMQVALDIVNGVYLGASRNIRMINDVFCLIVENSDVDDVHAILRILFDTADFFARTRGKNTPVIGNSINQTLQGLSEMTFSSKASLLLEMEKRRSDFNEKSLVHKQMIAELGANILANRRNILAFDYSSSMLAILEELAKRKNLKHLLITESRDLDGGRPIVREILNMGHTANYIIDMSLLNHFQEIDAIIFGAETINIDGSCYNTVGSLIVSTLAYQFDKPIYIASELAKLDTATCNGQFKAIKNKNYKSLLDPNNEFSSDSIVFDSQDLDLVPAKHITSYITEFGIIPPSGIPTVAKHEKFI